MSRESGGDSGDGGEATVERQAAFSAEFDPVLAERLDKPARAEAIYLEEASLFRPIATGDIFQGATVPGPREDDEPQLAMVIAHPSAMRKGAELRPWLRAAPVICVDGLSKRKWAEGHFGVFPLPKLAATAEANGFEVPDIAWGAVLDLAAPIDTAKLEVQNRCACLSPEGIHLVLQQTVYSDTRVPVITGTLAQVMEPKLEELEMLQTWNETFVEEPVSDGGDLQNELAGAAKDFDDVMNATSPTQPESIRSLLESGTGSGTAHRLFATEIRRRQREQA